MRTLDRITHTIEQLAEIKQLKEPFAIMQNTFDSAPDTMIGLFEYQSIPPRQTFGDKHGFGDLIETKQVQVRVRARSPLTAEQLIGAIDAALLAYEDDDALYRRTSGVYTLGKDGANPPRWEYTANYEVAESGDMD